ncbi:YceI family protein [Haliangium ochraceum]|uniref:YceI family protein n=1 Tax=Haliangium ochraceum (strain DSM 14365 / JCM 11303 / SMP-2) TaxID=502025 RepID=D0LIU5_HALO1|nr:YceI family protein [Haliangium ochraceum]ACY12974.1 YceI family protein [Haliangium ochraceum DSM 14365]
MERSPRSPYWAIAPALLAVLASLARWLQQGSGNLYTALDKRFYIPDPVVGWRITEDSPLWLGVDVVGMLTAYTVTLVVVARFVGQRERQNGATWSPGRNALWGIAAIPLIVPVWAFASGGVPEGAREALPPGVIGPPPGGFEGTLAGLPAGRYEIVSGAESAVTAHLKAGGEEFDARFAGGLSGTLQFDPSNLEAPLNIEVRVDASSVDTGVSMRSKHAASEDFLDAAKHPELRFSTAALSSSRQGDSPSQLVFWTDGTVTIMGKELSVPVQGTVSVLDEQARERVGADAPGLVVTADFPLDLAETPLPAEEFDETRATLRAVLILTHRPE